MPKNKSVHVDQSRHVDTKPRTIDVDAFVAGCKGLGMTDDVAREAFEEMADQDGTIKVEDLHGPYHGIFRRRRLSQTERILNRIFN